VRELLAEECLTLAFRGAPASAAWLDAAEAEALLAAEPEGNVTPYQATHFLRGVIDGFDVLRPYLDEMARRHGEELLEAHRRVRAAAQQGGVAQRVEPQLPPDVLGVYIYLPRA